MQEVYIGSSQDSELSQPRLDVDLAAAVQESTRGQMLIGYTECTRRKFTGGNVQSNDIHEIHGMIPLKIQLQFQTPHASNHVALASTRFFRS